MKLDRNALLSVLLVFLIALTLAVAAFRGRLRQDQSPAGNEVVLARLNDLELMLLEQEQALVELKTQNADLEARLVNLEQFETRPRPSLDLPEAYLKQVQRFFKSEAVRDLLSPAAKRLGIWRFSDPVFIEPQLISVVYSNGLQTETMICRIEVTDYYDLQLNVVWDSLEGKR
jgi:hypothetical protein